MRWPTSLAWVSSRPLARRGAAGLSPRQCSPPRKPLQGKVKGKVPTERSQTEMVEHDPDESGKYSSRSLAAGDPSQSIDEFVGALSHSSKASSTSRKGAPMA